MLAYSLRRLAISIPVLLMSTFVVFVMVSLSGDPLTDLRSRNPRPSEAVLRGLEQKLRLDEALPIRYWHWITGLFRGDLGPTRQDLDLPHVVATRFGVTLRLVVAAMLIAVIMAVVVGVISAVKQYSGVDYTFTFVGFLFLAMPTFWFAILLKQGAISFNNHFGDGGQIFYTIGEKSVIQSGSNLADILGHLILPTAVLAMTSFAAWSRYGRASMLEVLNSDYVRLARAKGLTRRRVMVRHALRTALIPLTTVTALDLGAIISGAVITETVFQWQGAGRFLIESIGQREVYAVLSWLLVSGLAIIVFNLIADLLYAVLDPRIRYE
jgi:peptide/nickel transport system permease protein